MKKITLNISTKQHEAFKQLAQREGLPYSELIRRALDEFLRRYASDLPRPNPLDNQTRREEA